jgi:nucleotide-binding universal stress UspA family protein
VKILVPLDGSTLALNALPVAGELARVHNGTVLLLTVGEIAETSRHAEEARAQLERMLADAAGRIQMVPAETRIELAGDAASAILSVVSDAAVDQIVMTTHGRSGLTQLAKGSVAEGIVRGTTVPVTLVRPAGEPENEAT